MALGNMIGRNYSTSDSIMRDELLNLVHFKFGHADQWWLFELFVSTITIDSQPQSFKKHQPNVPSSGFHNWDSAWNSDTSTGTRRNPQKAPGLWWYRYVVESYPSGHYSNHQNNSYISSWWIENFARRHLQFLQTEVRTREPCILVIAGC